MRPTNDCLSNISSNRSQLCSFKGGGHRRAQIILEEGKGRASQEFGLSDTRKVRITFVVMLSGLGQHPCSLMFG